MTSLRKEWLLIWRSGRLVWLLFSLLIMLVMGICSSSYQYQQAKSLRTQAESSERSRWVNQGEKNPHSAAHYGIYLFKPRTPLSVIDPGVGDYQGEFLFLEAHKRNNPAFSKSQDSIELQRLGTLSPAIIIQLLMPLFVILCGFSFFAGERERGTLSMLLLSGISPKKLAYHKLFSLLSVLVVFLIPVVAYCGLLMLSDGDVDSYRLVAMAVLYIGYVIFWVLLTLSVSVLTKASSTALMVLLIFWLFTSLIIPKFAVDVAVRLHPNVSSQEFYARMESDLYTKERIVAIETFKQDTLEKHGVKNTADLPFNWAGAELLFGEAYSDRVFDSIFNYHEKQLIKQNNTYQALAVLSPLMIVQVMSSALAATDWLHHHWFVVSAEKYRRSVMETLNKSVLNSKKDEHHGNRVLWEHIPKHSYQNPSFYEAVGSYSRAIASMGIWLFLVSIASYLSISRLSREATL